MQSLVAFVTLATVWAVHPGPASGAACNEPFIYLNATPEHQFLQSPNYPNNYFNNELCRWVLQTTKSYEIVKFHMTQYRIQYTANCAADYVEVKDGRQLWSASIKQYCGSGNRTETLLGTASAILVIFKTGHASTDTGFEMEYWTAPRGETEYSPPSLTTVHYILFGVFAIIVSSIFLVLLFIFVVRRSPSLYNRFIWKQQPKRRTKTAPPGRTISVITVVGNGAESGQLTRKESTNLLTNHITASSTANLIEVG